MAGSLNMVAELHREPSMCFGETGTGLSEVVLV